MTPEQLKDFASHIHNLAVMAEDGSLELIGGTGSIHYYNDPSEVTTENGYLEVKRQGVMGGKIVINMDATLLDRSKS